MQYTFLRSFLIQNQNMIANLIICRDWLWLFLEILHYFGILIYRKDVRLPQQLQRAMAAEAEAAREARAKVIAAEGEHKSSRAVAHAAEIISQTPAALQVKSNNLKWFLDSKCSQFLFNVIKIYNIL